tara:strand:- start:461 stop:1108 length:648 start_codon:yes stop_codon:yes gene_type:complete
MNKKILAIETSSNICSISYLENDNLIFLKESDTPRKHVELLPEYYLKLKKEIGLDLKQISAIAVSIGPGSFTGLRIGLSFAKGLAFSSDLPIIPVPTILSLAYNIKADKPLLGIVLSHSKRVFYQEFNWGNNILSELGPVQAKDWDEINFSNYDSGNAFQWGCEGLISNEKLLVSKPSSKSIGLLANINFDNWIVKKPYSLESNYVSPFKVGTKK